MSDQTIHSPSADTEKPTDFTILYRPSAPPAASWSVTRLPLERSFDSSIASLGCESGSCVLAGTQILLADGTTKAIETFIGGEMVRTLTGVSRVRALKNPILGVTRRIIELRVGSRAPLMISDEHAMWMRFEQGGMQSEWWGVYNFNHYLVQKENGYGVRLKRDAHAVRFDISQVHAHIEGWKHVQPIYHMMHPHTPLYHLDVEEGGAILLMASSSAATLSTRMGRAFAGPEPESRLRRTSSSPRWPASDEVRRHDRVGLRARIERMIAPAPVPQERQSDPDLLCPIPAGIGKISGDLLRLRLADEILEVTAPASYLDKLFEWCQGELSLAQIGERSLAHFGDNDFAVFVADMLAAGVLVDASLGLAHFARMLEKRGKRGLSFSLPTRPVATPLPQQTGHLIGLGALPDSGLLSMALGRSSASGFGGGAFSKSSLNALLFAAYGQGKNGRRVVASAGGLYPLTLYVVLLSDIEDIPPGSYKVRFSDGEVRLEALPSADAAQVPRALANPAIMRGAAGWLLISGDIRPGTLKYGNRAFSHALIEAGAVVQNIALAATELGCAWSAMGIIDTPHAGSLFGCDPGSALPIVGGLFGNPDAITTAADRTVSTVPQIHFEWMEERESLPFHIGRATIVGSPVQGHGRDADPARAYDKALAEAVERYAYRQPRDCRVARWGELPGMLAPQTLVDYLPSQFRSKGFPFRPFNPARQYLWREAVNLQSGVSHWVPAECVYALSSLPVQYRKHALTSANSSGCASGRSTRAAQAAALFEVAERDAFMRHWFAQRGGKGVKLESLPLRWASRIGELSCKGCHVSLQMLDLGLFPVWLFFVQHADRHFTAVSAAAAADGEHALGSALSEIETAVSVRMAGASRTDLRPELVKSADDHASLYAHPRYFRRADALGKPLAEIDYGVALECFSGSTADISLRLRDAGTFALWVDMTLQDAPSTIDGTRLVSGRILVPHAIPIGFGDGRMPLAMDGFANRQARFPHPFP